MVSVARRATVEQRMGNGEHGVWTGTVFDPPDPTMRPDDLFVQRPINSIGPGGEFERFCIRNRHATDGLALKTVAIFTGAAACVSGGGASSSPHRAGFAFFVNLREHGTESGVLEHRGTDGPVRDRIKGAADIRAVIAALSSRAWLAEGWQRIVIIVNPNFWIDTATVTLREWAAHDWMRHGRLIVNWDLWADLSKEMGVLAEGGCEVSFWSVPKEHTFRAREAARRAAEAGKGKDSDEPT